MWIEYDDKCLPEVNWLWEGAPLCGSCHISQGFKRFWNCVLDLIARRSSFDFNYFCNFKTSFKNLRIC